MNIKKLNISVFSYNVFWKIMKLTNSPLINSMGNEKLKELKSNILKNISNVKKYYNPFIYCFQESESIEDIIKLFENSKYAYHITYSEPEHMLTIWQHRVLKKIFSIDAEFEPGRPFVIFIFKDLRFDNYFMLINIHSGHNTNTILSIFNPIQKSIDSKNKIFSKYNIKRIIIVGDFNRDIGEQIILQPNKFKLYLNLVEFNFYPILTKNKTCCNIKGYAYNKNYDQIIDSYKKPILTHSLNKELWYIPASSDHLAILSVVKNFI